MSEEDSRRFVFSRKPAKVYPPLVDHASGSYVFDLEGKKVMECCSGEVFAISIGHGIKEVIDAMHKQARKICFASGRVFHSEPLMKLAEKVASFTPKGLSRSSFVNSGSEANEAAMRVARMYHLERGDKQKWRVISRWGSYHGATAAALSMTGVCLPIREDLDPYLFDFPHIQPCYCYRCPFEKEYPECDVMCARELETTIKHYGAETVSAFIADPIPSYLACPTPPLEYFPIIREICDKHDVLLVDDEVITGFGRTGKKMGIDHWNVVPDILTSAKGLSSGYSPLAAIVVHEKVFDELPMSETYAGHTYGGNPLSCAVGLAVLEYIEKNNLVERAAMLGSHLLEKIGNLEDIPWVGRIEGKGLLLGCELVTDKDTRSPLDPDKLVTILDFLFKKGFLIRGGTEPFRISTISRLLIAPPFIIEKAEIDQMVDSLEETILKVQTRMR